MELERIERALRNALGRDQRPLLETEGLEILQAMGIAVPKHLVIPGIRADPRVSEAELAAFPGDRVVLKALSRDILHKTELGAVVILPKRQEALLAEMQRMESALARTHRIEGFLLEEFIPYDPALGGESPPRHALDGGLRAHRQPGTRRHSFRASVQPALARDRAGRLLAAGPLSGGDPERTRRSGSVAAPHRNIARP